MRIGVLKEQYPGERRVALVPAALPPLTKAGAEVLVERGAGASAGFTDQAYVEKGAAIVARDEVFARADVVALVRLGNRNGSPADVSGFRSGQTLIGLLDPLSSPALLQALAGKGVTAFAMELIPRIARAQSMDALSSQAMIAGYKAALLAATHLPRVFPMVMTAAGTLNAAKVFVLGAGVAGLQAIASSRRLGATVDAYDVRPSVKDQVQSVGGTFVELQLEAATAEDTRGYAVAQDESFYRRQREMLMRLVPSSNAVITTAAIPGKKAPVLITREMVERMEPGSVIVDLAAERGGNCEATVPDQTVQVNGVTVLGPTNLPATVPYHASQMYARNVATFLLHLMKDGMKYDTADEITRETMVARGGQVLLQLGA